MPPTRSAVAGHAIWGKAVSAVLGGAAAAAVFYVIKSFGQTREAILILVGGVLVVALLLILYRLVLGWFRRRKAAPMTRSILANSSAAPHGISDPSKRAKLDEMRKSFETGVNKFKAAGKDLYTLPWFVLVGEPGGGKTEAIRHSQVGFPHGLQDYMQGAGGTVNMNWWFTNHAIILDTAGRLMFEEVAPGTTNEWGEFLALLRQNRPNCPINGMILVIPADTLIKDTTEAIERKAGKIAQQLDLIQRTLEVRFPVFVVISKCDLIGGFREFFETVDDPQLQGQILGWSNPMSLDQPFNPEAVDKHLETVRQRLAARRYGLLLDPVNTEDPDARRIDQVDALFTFPDSLARVAPRLRRYLETIFVAGEWSPKPLFLRGIYFTSSMREGAALDAELAEVLKVPVDSLQDEGRAWERNKTFFLREPFLKKIFVEKGLVTRAARPNRLHRVRKIAVLTAGFLSIFALAGLTYKGGREFKDRLGGESDFWPRVQQGYTTSTWKVVNDKGEFNDQKLPELNASLNDLFAEAPDRYQRKIDIPKVFRPTDFVSDPFSEERRLDAYRAVYETAVLRPLLDRVRGKMTAMKPQEWNADATAALQELVRLEAAAQSASPPPIRLQPFFKFALADAREFNKYQAKQQEAGERDLEKTATWLYPSSGVKWPPETIGLGSAESSRAFAAAVGHFKNYWDSQLDTKGPSLERANTLKQALDDYETARVQVDGELKKIKGPILVGADYDNLKSSLARANEVLGSKRKEIEAAAATAGLGASSSVASIQSAYERSANELNSQVKLAYRDLREAGAKTEVPRLLGEPPQRSLDDNQRAMLLSLDDQLKAVDPQAFPDLPRYAVAQFVYGRALDELANVSATGASRAEPGQLAQTLAAIGKATTDREAEIKETSAKLSGKNLTYDTALEAWNLAARAAASARRKAALAAVLDDFGGRSTEEQVKRLGQIAPLAHPATIPFTSLNRNGEPFRPEFDPTAAQTVLKSIGQLRNHFPSDADDQAVTGAKARVLDFEALRAKYVALQGGTGEYLKHYLDYWSKDVRALAAFRGDQLKKWSEFFQDANGPRRWNADTINTGLEQLVIRMDSSLRVAYDVGDEDTKVAVRRVQEELNGYRDAMKGNVFRDACRTVLQSWLQSRGNAAAARRSILDLTPPQIHNYIYTTEGAGFVTQYWTDLSYRLLEVLVAECESESKNHYGAIAANFDAFPLTLTDRRKELTPAELKAARAAVDKLLDASTREAGAAGRGQTIGPDNLPATVERHDLLKRLISPEGGSPRLRRLGLLMDALDPEDPATCTVQLMDEKRRAQMMVRRPGRKAEDPWRDIRLQQGTTLLGEMTNDPAASPLKPLGSFKVRGETPVTLLLGKRAAANQANTPVPFGTTWPGLRLVYGPGVKWARPGAPPKKDDANGLLHTWDVEIEVADGGAKYSLWLVVVFDRELPHPDEWSQSLR